MDVMEKLLIQTLETIPREIAAQVVEEKLNDQGIKIPNSKILLLSDRVLKANSDRIMRGDSAKLFFWDWKFWRLQKHVIKITKEDMKLILQSIGGIYSNKLNVFIDDSSDRLSDVLLESVLKTWPKTSRLHDKIMKRFHRNLIRRWGEPLDRLDMLVTLSSEFGERIKDHLREKNETQSPYLDEILIRLHIRALQVSREILCLLQSGFPDGAMSRWRTLHEIAAVALYIVGQGEDLAERYYLHEIIETRRGAIQYQGYKDRLKLEPIDPEELNDIEKEYLASIDLFGKQFDSPHGWAAHHLGIERPTFADIERASGVDHWRPYYKMASDDVHANPRGVFYKLGVFDSPDALLSGPSNAGLADPGGCTCHSLMQVNTALLQLSSSLDLLVLAKALSKLADAAEDAFDRCGQELSSDVTALDIS